MYYDARHETAERREDGLVQLAEDEAHGVLVLGLILI